MTFDEAWAAHLKRQNIIPPNQQTFRHGWNAALEAALIEIDETHGDGFEAKRRVQTLEVEVQTS